VKHAGRGSGAEGSGQRFAFVFSPEQGRQSSSHRTSASSVESREPVGSWPQVSIESPDSAIGADLRLRGDTPSRESVAHLSGAYNAEIGIAFHQLTLVARRLSPLFGAEDNPDPSAPFPRPSALAPRSGLLFKLGFFWCD